MTIIKFAGDDRHRYMHLPALVLIQTYFAMNNSSLKEIKAIIDTPRYRPAISIILPIQIHINKQSELAHSLKLAIAKVEKEISADYPADTVKSVIQKLKNLTATLDAGHDKKSIAIYVSPIFEKVFYLDIKAEEKIIIDESFEIRDLVYSKTELHKYLVLLLNSRQCRLFLGDGSKLSPLQLSVPDTAFAYVNDAPDRVANFSDMQDRKEVIMDKFLQHIDTALDEVQHIYHLPLIVAGTDKLIGHFKNFSRHKTWALEYLNYDIEEDNMPALSKILEQPIKHLQNVKQSLLLKKLEEAASANRLVTGIENVWKECFQGKGQLLVTEKNYMFAAVQGSSKDVIYEAQEPFNHFSSIKDAVDDVIETVIANGGQVEFVDEDTLRDFHHIALVRYY